MVDETPPKEVRRSSGRMLVIVGIVLAIVVVTFVGMNISHYREATGEAPNSANYQGNALTSN